MADFGKSWLHDNWVKSNDQKQAQRQMDQAVRDFEEINRLKAELAVANQEISQLKTSYLPDESAKLVQAEMTKLREQLAVARNDIEHYETALAYSRELTTRFKPQLAIAIEGLQSIYQVSSDKAYETLRRIQALE